MHWYVHHESKISSKYVINEAGKKECILYGSNNAGLQNENCSIDTESSSVIASGQSKVGAKIGLYKGYWGNFSR